MDNDISKNMSEELKEIKSINFKQELQKNHYKTDDTMAPDIQLSKLQNMIRAQLMKNSDEQNIETSATCIINEPGTLSNQDNVKNINTKYSNTTEILKHIKTEEMEEINMEPILIKDEKENDNNSFDGTKMSELNNENIKTKPGIVKLEGTSELLNQENIGINETAHGNIEYSFTNIITMMAHIHGEEYDGNMLTNMNLPCNINKPEAREKNQTDNIRPKLTKLVEFMKKKLQNKLNQAKPEANIHKQPSDSEPKCENVDVNMGNNISLNVEQLLTSSEKTVKRACITSTEIDKTKHCYKCRVCKAEFTNSSDFASHLLKCEINTPILRSRHNTLRHVVEKNTCKCTRTRVKKRKFQ